MEPKMRRVLAGHLRELMARRPDLETQAKLAKASGVAQTTVGRILNAKVAATLDNIESMAGAFGVPAAALLADDQVSSVIELNRRAIQRLPDQEKSKIAAFIIFTLAQNSRNHDTGRLSFAEETAADADTQSAAISAARRPIRNGSLIDDNAQQHRPDAEKHPTPRQRNKSASRRR